MGGILFKNFDRLLSDSGAEAMLRIAERFGSYGTYKEESIEDDFGENLAQRHDALMNFIRTGGRFGRRESIHSLAVRTNYFRETYAYGKPLFGAIEPFFRNEDFIEAARKIFDRPIVRPAIVYANFLVPGQELAVHTDVPEFRGINRTKDPQWLIVAMLHSGLFDSWRIPIATAVAWFGSSRGGEFVFYPEGPFGRPVAIEPKHNTAIILDTDSVFHGVDRVFEDRGSIPAIETDMRLFFEGGDRWYVGSQEKKLAYYNTDDLRFSLSWKAHCFADGAEERIVAEHTDDLTRAEVLETLVANLRERGRIEDEIPGDTDLALMIMDEYIKFPPPNPDASASTK